VAQLRVKLDDVDDGGDGDGVGDDDGDDYCFPLIGPHCSDN
jgi:hypothetical protein